MNAPRQSIIAGLVSGEVDYAGIGGAQTAFRSRARDLDVSIIGCTSSTTNYLLLGNNKVMLRAIGDTPLRAAAIENRIIAAAPFGSEEGVRLLKAGYSLISNFSESLGIPQNVLITRN